MLLETIRARGGKITVARGESGAAKIQIAPRGLVPDLASEIQRFKPQLLELLAPPPSTAPRVPLELDAPTLARTARRLQCAHPQIWRSMNGDGRIQLTVCAALLELKRDVPREWEQWRDEGKTP